MPWLKERGSPANNSGAAPSSPNNSSGPRERSRKMSHARTLAAFFTLVLWLPSAPVRAQIGAEGVLASVNALSPKQRTETLIAEARKEGSVEWYGSLLVPEATQMIEKFRGRYPFIEVRYTRGSGTQTINRFLTEA